MPLSKMFRCDQCDKRYSSKRSLNAHNSKYHIHPVLKSHHNALKMLGSASSENYRRVIDNTPQLNGTIKKLCQHILRGKLKLNEDHIRKLMPHRDVVRKIAHKPHKDIKGTIQTGGNIIQSIINTVLPLITALL